MRFALSLVAAVSALSASAFAQDEISTSQYWHERYHGILSMAVYGDYNTLCPQYFTRETLLQNFPDSTAEPWEVIEEWGPTSQGLSGISVIIPEMDKVVQVFKGFWGWETLNLTAVDAAVPLNLGNCTDCKVMSAALDAYLEARELTNDWAIMKDAINRTGAQWSVTGHGFAGAVSLVSSLDLGWRGLCHWSHSHGAPRTLSPNAAALYNSLYGGEAGQRCVANNDIMTEIIPESEDYTYTLQGFHVYGENSTFGMNYEVCLYDETDPRCAGGQEYTNENFLDHYFYYTPIGQCAQGSDVFYNATYQQEWVDNQIAAYQASASTSFEVSTYFSDYLTESSTSSAEPTTTASGDMTSSAASGDASATPSSASDQTDNSTGAAGTLSGSMVAAVAAAFLGAIASL